jgi:serine/threonine protein kinase/formylglycine-generating enzyme required for sulfatase activity
MHSREPDLRRIPDDEVEAESESGDGSARERVEQDDLLLELLARWEEGCLRSEDAIVESLGICDPILINALRERIDNQKRLYAFLRFSNDSAQNPSVALANACTAADNAPLGPIAGRHNDDLTHVLDRTDPATIGRYRVVRVLGQGGFGRVYLAQDPDLDRLVAVKVPVSTSGGEFLDIESYLREARILAGLSHPNIVPVYDVGRTETGQYYVVSKYMAGGDLAARLERGRLSFSKAAEMIAALAAALHHAHTRDLFHRDIKPANVLIDSTGSPSLADFGLALKDEDLGTGARFIGTASYMSPEQARGEGHLVDGRSDVFSMGIVFYEMLTGRRPFRGASREEVMQKIIESEPRPPRQILDSIPKELERICLKALAKRAPERYSTARDLADDLRHFLQKSPVSGEANETPGAVPDVTAIRGQDPVPVSNSGLSHLGRGPIKIVPRGLSSFDDHDADFFLELLPGPRDRDGLPDSLRFWKMRIEATDADKTFRVGIMYGPSGCGKSSLVKAGLLPLVAKLVSPIYVEATGADTEARLLRGVLKSFPRIAADSSLVDAFAYLRRGKCLRAERKALIVLDQFEQWLFARRPEQGTELIAALRHCDGEHLQALCLVRDEFWMATTRFMRDLEIDLVPDRNLAAVDLFDLKHARKVLAAYGRAYETLPGGVEPLSREQSNFLEQAVASLAQDGKVVPVRLALFAEMVKGKPWVPATLREVGGMEGVGVKFLQETFSSSRSSPKHRYHQMGAQAVLKALLPETDTDIKGRMRSLDELRAAAGYTDHSADFGELIRVLDDDLRLITPVDLPSSIEGKPTADRYYQLTHDYLVHSLRNWLTLKQRETRKGRFELVLAERTTLWTDKPESRRLPSLREWIAIRMFTRPKEWNEAQRRMMAHAARVHGARIMGLLLAVGLTTTLAAGFGVYFKTQGLLTSLATADVEKMPSVLDKLADYPRWAYSGRLRELAARPGNDPRSQLGFSLALIPGDSSQLEYLIERLRGADPAEMIVLRNRLATYRNDITSRLWKELRAAAEGDGQIRSIAGTLAVYDAGNPSWAGLGGKVASALVRAPIDDVKEWREALRGVRDSLVEPLAAIFSDKARPEDERTNASRFLARYAEDRPALLVTLLTSADPKSFATLFPVIERNRSAVLTDLQDVLASGRTSPRFDPVVGDQHGHDARPAGVDESEQAKNERAAQRARAAVALVRLGHGDQVWHIFEHSADPRLRTALVCALQPFGADPEILVRELDRLTQGGTNGAVSPATSGQPNGYLFELETSKRRALILALAEYPREALAADDQAAIVRKLSDVYQNDPDAGIHSGLELLLTRWGEPDRLNSERRRPEDKPTYPHRWYSDAAGETMVVIDGPAEFRMGSPPSEKDRLEIETPHRRIIPRRFAIATQEVTIDQFQTYMSARGKSRHQFKVKYSPDTKGPQIWVTWFEAASYCNWKSDMAGLPRCYQTSDQGDCGLGTRVDAEAVAQGGYRLPTDGEWEYACRAGAITSRYYGDDPELLGRFEWYVGNSGFRAQPCGRLLPNDFGLFDMLGNVDEWCHNRHSDYRPDPDGTITDKIVSETIMDEKRDIRCHDFSTVPWDLRSAARQWLPPSERENDLGFRVARTIPGN